MQHAADQHTVLVIDDEESLCVTFEMLLKRQGYRVATAQSISEARHILASEAVDLVFADIILGGDSGLSILREVHARKLTCPVIMVTGAPNFETASEALRLGAFDYLSKPVTRENLLRVSSLAIRHKQLTDEKLQIQAENEHYRRNLEAIFRSVQESIITVDPELNIIAANAAAQDFFQSNRITVPGTPVRDVIDAGNAPCLTVLEETITTRRIVKEYRVELAGPRQKRRVAIINSAPLLDRHKAFMGAVLAIRDITRLADLEEELRQRHHFHNLVGKSKIMLQVYQLAEHLAETETTVLITGESGTGKELVADAIHYSGRRALKPLVKVNCSALAENLLESELFGHVRGAFTGAQQDKTGRFQLADGGTILLDEIGDISPLIQLKLLRVLQEKVFERVGDATPIKVDVRVIAATNSALKEKIRRGIFREDLYYRLKVVEIKLPALRDHMEDLPLLMEHFCKQFNRKYGKRIRGLTEQALQAMMRYGWPGNVRELEHALEHAYIVCSADLIDCSSLPPDICSAPQAAQNPVRSAQPTPPADIDAALQRAGGNKAEAARLLGISRQTVYRHLKRAAPQPG